jgi:hypothetical protein
VNHHGRGGVSLGHKRSNLSRRIGQKQNQFRACVLICKDIGETWYILVYFVSKINGEIDCDPHLLRVLVTASSSWVHGTDVEVWPITTRARDSSPVNAADFQSKSIDLQIVSRYESFFVQDCDSC